MTIHIYTTELILELKDVLFKSSISGSTSKKNLLKGTTCEKWVWTESYLYKSKKKKFSPRFFSWYENDGILLIYISMWVLFLYDVEKLWDRFFLCKTKYVLNSNFGIKSCFMYFFSHNINRPQINFFPHRNFCVENNLYLLYIKFLH